MQTTYLQALRDWDCFTENEEPTALRAHHWLAGILYHRFADQTRRRSRRHKTLFNYYRRAAPDFAPQEPETEFSAGMLRVLEKLSADHREVITRMYVVGDSYAKIAADLGVTIVVVRARLHHARCALAPLLRSGI